MTFNMSLTKISWEDVLAFMPHKTLANIISEPTYTAVHKLKRKIGANLTAVKVSWGHNKGSLVSSFQPQTEQAKSMNHPPHPHHNMPTFPMELLSLREIDCRL
jgi:hypothetical protein